MRQCENVVIEFLIVIDAIIIRREFARIN